MCLLFSLKELLRICFEEPIFGFIYLSIKIVYFLISSEPNFVIFSVPSQWKHIKPEFSSESEAFAVSQILLVLFPVLSRKHVVLLLSPSLIQWLSRNVPNWELFLSHTPCHFKRSWFVNTYCKNLLKIVEISLYQSIFYIFSCVFSMPPTKVPGFQWDGLDHNTKCPKLWLI